jgi:Domain of unknown function (DUF4337)
MAEEKKEKWLNYLALSTVIFAVCATLSTFKGGGFGSRALLNQSNASDQWSFFQSKSIKSYIFENQKDNLEIQRAISAKNPNAKEELAKYDAKISSYEKKITQYEQDKTEIKAKAENFEKERDDCQKHGGRFGIAVIYLQVTILLSTIAGLLKKKPVWFLSLLIGAVGILYFIDGFYLFMKFM